MENELLEFIEETEGNYFRTNQDTGANDNALFIWNLVRKFAKLPKLEKSHLPAFCSVHNKYHLIKDDYGCKRKSE